MSDIRQRDIDSSAGEMTMSKRECDFWAQHYADAELLGAYDDVARWRPLDQAEADERERLLEQHHTELVRRGLSW